MAEVLGAASAIAGLVSLADLVLSRGFKCLVYLKKVRNAEKEVLRLLDETSAVNGLFAWIRSEIQGFAQIPENG
jgi:hypothetical protein